MSTKSKGIWDAADSALLQTDFMAAEKAAHSN
jgi:hypothetical protein